MKTILAVIGEDRLSQEVLMRSIKMAILLEAKIIVLYTIQIPFLDIPSYNNDVPLDKKEIKKHIEAKVEMLKGERSIESYTLVYFGDRTQQAIIEANRESVDLVISSPEIKIEKFVTESRRHLLVVHHKTKPYQKILVPTDLSENSKEAIGYTRNLLPQASIRLVHAYESIVVTSSLYDISYVDMLGYEEENREISRYRLDQICEELEVEGELIDTTFSLYATLVEYIEQQQPDLVVVASGSSEFFNFGSVSTYIAKESPCDVLIYCMPQS